MAIGPSAKLGTSEAKSKGDQVQGVGTTQASGDLERDETANAVQEVAPVDLRLLHILVREVGVQCRFALLAFDNLYHWDLLIPVMYPEAETSPFRHPLNPQIGRMHGIPGISGRWTDAGSSYSDADELVFFLAHAFLGHAASVSRLLIGLKPARKDHPYSELHRRERARQMRDALGVTDDSLLLTSDFRDVRNSLEHVDERLEVWFQTEAGQRLDMVDMNHSPFGWAAGGSEDVPEHETFRMLGGQSVDLRFAASVQSLEPVAQELRLLLENTHAWQMSVRGIRLGIDGVQGS